MHRPRKPPTNDLRQVLAAYALLRDPARRADYDRATVHAAKPPQSPHGPTPADPRTGRPRPDPHHLPNHQHDRSPMLIATIAGRPGAPALIHLMKTEDPIDVIAGLKPATGSAWIPHRRLQTDSVGAAEGRRRKCAVALTTPLSCAGVTSTLPVIVTKDIVAGVVAVPHGWGHKGTGGWQVANGAGGQRQPLMSSAAGRPREAGRHGPVDRRAGADRASDGQTRCATSALTAWSRKSGGISGHSGRHRPDR